MRRALAASCVSLLIAGTSVGCFDHQCDGDVVGPYGDQFGEGQLIDDVTWQSTPIAGPWMNFAAGRRWKFHVAEWERERRKVVSTAAYVSVASSPNTTYPGGGHDNFTYATGNLAEGDHLGAGTFEMINATCTQLYLRVVAHAGPPGSAGVDSGTGDAQTE